jgi:glutaredoxin
MTLRGFSRRRSPKRNLVTVYTRKGCHLCDEAIQTLESLQPELQFDIERRFIEGDPILEDKYGERIPVIHIDGEHHDFYRVDPERFKTSLARYRQRQ